MLSTTEGPLDFLYSFIFNAVIVSVHSVGSLLSHLPLNVYMVNYYLARCTLIYYYFFMCTALLLKVTTGKSSILSPTVSVVLLSSKYTEGD